MHPQDTFQLVPAASRPCSAAQVYPCSRVYGSVGRNHISPPLITADGALELFFFLFFLITQSPLATFSNQDPQ